MESYNKEPQDQAIASPTASTRTWSNLDVRRHAIACAIFGVGILYYCFAYLLRVYPSVMEPQLLAHFNLTAGSFGTLTSFYYFAYAPMQLPVGVTVDKVGPRRALMIAGAIALTGVWLFANCDTVALAYLGRFMVGFGAAFAYVTALKLATMWLPKRLFATATGMLTGGGMLAAIFTYNYLTESVQLHGLHHALFFPLMIGANILTLIVLIVRDKPKHKTVSTDTQSNDDESNAVSFRQLGHFLLQIIKCPQMWLIGVVGALLYLPSSVFLDVWAAPFFEHVYKLTPAQAAHGVSLVLFGWIASSFLTGMLSDWIGRRKPILIVAAFGAMAVASVIIFDTHLSTVWLYALLFVLGICCGPHPLCFTLGKENQPQHISGTAIAFTNFVVMMGGFIFQPSVGYCLDFLWSGGLQQGIRIYTTHHYVIALSIMPIGLLLAGLLALKIREPGKPECQNT